MAYVSPDTGPPWLWLQLELVHIDLADPHFKSVGVEPSIWCIDCKAEAADCPGKGLWLLCRRQRTTERTALATEVIQAISTQTGEVIPQSLQRAPDQSTCAYRLLQAK